MKKIGVWITSLLLLLAMPMTCYAENEPSTEVSMEAEETEKDLDDWAATAAVVILAFVSLELINQRGRKKNNKAGVKK